MVPLNASLEFRERNAIVAQKWAALSEDNRKEWAVKAEAVCSAAIQVGVVSGESLVVEVCSPDHLLKCMII